MVDATTEGNGLTGLANVGNSCYLNSVLQVLSHTHELTSVLVAPEYQSRITKKLGALVLNEWGKLRTLMWSEDCTIAPWGFVAATRKVAAAKKRMDFTNVAQNDVAEFIDFLFECFHEGLSRSVEMVVKGAPKTSKDMLAAKCYDMMKRTYEAEYSEMLGLFHGISVSRVCSLDGKVLGVSPEPFTMLQIPVMPGSTFCTLQDCITEYCKKERLDGDNAYRIDKTGVSKLVSADKDFTFWSLPTVLIIHLKRFSNVMGKVKRDVAVPIELLDMSPYVTGYKRWQYKYELYAVCNHGGGVRGGHYHAHVNTMKGWYNFNDTTVTALGPHPSITNSAYCLFYRKKK